MILCKHGGAIKLSFFTLKILFKGGIFILFIWVMYSRGKLLVG